MASRDLYIVQLRRAIHASITHLLKAILFHMMAISHKEKVSCNLISDSGSNSDGVGRSKISKVYRNRWR